jgi:hypothetical protein
MAYLTESQLRAYASTLSKSATESKLRSSRATAAVSIFLSHSHLDRDLALGLIKFLASQGIPVYVDWNDSGMPEITDRTTAQKIKEKIKENTLFMMLATRNALASKWFPWETGVADQCKGPEKMVVIPVADPQGNFNGAEYLQLYRRVESEENGGYGIFPPGADKGFLVESYLRKFT